MTTPQQQAALTKANQVRSVQCRLKKTIAAQDFEVGKLLAAECITNPPPELSKVRVEDVLCSVRRIGDAKAHRFMRNADVSPRRRLGELTTAERERLEKHLS